MNWYAESEFKVSDENAKNFKLADYVTAPSELSDESQKSTNWLKVLDKEKKKLGSAQKLLMADGHFSLLLVFQAMDAAGKDSTIKHVFRGVNPAGLKIYSFKQPSKTELKHDFLWRTSTCFPERGQISIFNRSHYEEVLVVRVHPEYLGGQGLPQPLSYEVLNEKNDQFWQQRLDSIKNSESHLFDNGTLVLKFFLNVSRQEQHRRFLARLEDESKQWKFSGGDLKESALWGEYMNAYEQAIQNTSTDKAPWYVIPADDKPFMRATVANIVRKTIRNLPLEFPNLGEEQEQIDAWKSEINSLLSGE